MKLNFRKSQFLSVVTGAAAALMLMFAGCDDDPGVANYYTAKGEMASTFLVNRPDQYSEFVAIVQKSKKINFDLLGTYGSYTVFAPTNQAIDVYLAERGLSSVDDLTVADCDTIAATHILDQAYFTTDITGDYLPSPNMLDRYVSITCEADSVSNPGKTEVAYWVNYKALIYMPDDSVENGVVHTLSGVIPSTTKTLPDVLAEDTTISLFYTALRMTRFDDKMRNYIYRDYYCDPDSTDKGHTFQTGEEYDNVFYMQRRYYGYTGFIEQDEVFANFVDEEHGVTNGIHNLEELKAYAKAVYDEVYPECADIDDPTDSLNSLNRFVAYHFLDRRAMYNQLTVDNKMLTSNFDRRHWDVADWYETMAPYSIMKISYPSGSQEGRYVNRRGIQNRRDMYGIFIPGAKITPPSQVKVSQNATNGVYHYINSVITYGRQTQEVVMGERMRIDATTLSPDFMTSGARGHKVAGQGGCPDFPGQYGIKSKDTSPDTNPNTCIGFKAGSCRNFEYSDVGTHLHVRNRYLTFWSYSGDEVCISGRYDVTFKLPPVPEGDYEVRIQTIVGFETRGIIQVYFDGQPCGIPFDMRIEGTDSSVGWISDEELGDEEAIAAYDKSLHNRGWMKGPSSYGTTADNGSGTRAPVRNVSRVLRRVWHTFHSDGRTDHYMRVQQKLESSNGTFPFDYIELCPRSVYNNELYVEDRL